MTTLTDIAESARGEVVGYTATVEPTTFVRTQVSDSALTVSVVNASGFSRGIVEVGSELMMVSEVDRDAGVLTLESLGARGIRGTQATTHAVGERVVMSPVIPMSRALSSVQEALRADSGLFAVTQFQFDSNPPKSSYTLPDEFRTVLSVQWLPPGDSEEWLPLRRWTADRYSQALQLGEFPTPGRPVRVTYTTDPTVPDVSADFADTGLPESCVDVIRWSAAWRLASFMEPFNVAAVRAEANAMAAQNTPQSRLRIAQYFYGLYQQRLSDEVRSLQERYPIRQHWSGNW